jgi:excisionase family DNA binding protein
LAEQEFYSFDEALKQLRLKEEELKRLVSEGEIRAFREGETMKLRRSDVESLRSELSGGEVVDLGDVKEELVFEDDAALEEAGMATQEISDVETILDEPVEEVDEIEEEIEVVEIEEEDEVHAAASRSAPRALEPEPEIVEGPTEPMLVRVAVLLTFLVLVLAVPVCFSASGGKPSGFASAVASMLGIEAK